MACSHIKFNACPQLNFLLFNFSLENLFVYSADLAVIARRFRSPRTGVLELPGLCFNLLF